MNDKFLNLLGICRRAGSLCLGHDSGIESIVKNRAKLCVISTGASERLSNEFKHACSFEDKDVKVIEAVYDMVELSSAVGSKAAVVTVTDEGFAKKLIQLYAENIDNNSNN
ncbi:MAG: ribosomal L7Ae/L30e/S12e/Gadd45 family protein [Clostridia bacterium]